jgi:tetratricopeptide (TPR) repeat protein
VTVVIRAAALGLIALLALASVPAMANPLPQPEQIALPRERLALQHLTAFISEPADSGVAQLAVLDRILTETSGASALRGLVQFIRASILMDNNRDSESATAIEESIRLLPSYSAPLIVAVSIEAYMGRPGEGGDYFLRAIALDAEAARGIEDHELNNLVERLHEQHDYQRIRLIAARLFAIGWHGDDLRLRSSLALELIRARMAEGDLAGMRAALPNLAYPPHARGLLISLAYRSLWPDIEAWTGPLQQGQWLSYLAETRARWQASHDRAQAEPYAQALAAAGYDRTLVREMLPLLMGPLDPNRDYELIWVVPSVATALSHLGRWDDADALFSHLLTVWRFGVDPNALNITANQARLLLYRGRNQEALDLIDRTIHDAEHWGGNVSRAPLAGMHFVRACAQHRLGGGAEAMGSAAIAVHGLLGTAISTYLCLERPEAAQKLLIDALGRESLRDDVAELLQPDDSVRDPEALSRQLAAARETLRHDPAVLRALAAYARILPYSARAGAPAEETEQ